MRLPDNGADASTVLTRLTVNLIPSAADALQHAAASERLSRTDVVNRALQVYDFFLCQKMNGASIFVGQKDDLERVRLL